MKWIKIVCVSIWFVADLSLAMLILFCALCRNTRLKPHLTFLRLPTKAPTKTIIVLVLNENKQRLFYSLYFFIVIVFLGNLVLRIDFGRVKCKSRTKYLELLESVMWMLHRLCMFKCVHDVLAAYYDVNVHLKHSIEFVEWAINRLRTHTLLLEYHACSLSHGAVQ